jgi:hypothetical protein
MVPLRVTCWQGPQNARSASPGHTPAQLVLALLCYDIALDWEGEVEL